MNNVNDLVDTIYYIIEILWLRSKWYCKSTIIPIQSLV